MSQKKFKFEDLQPHVDMLCDALENKGASASGVPYKEDVYQFANRYRELLNQIRNRNKSFEDLIYDLNLLNHQTMEAAGNIQSYRINKIVHALDIFVMKEYNRYRSLPK